MAGVAFPLGGALADDKEKADKPAAAEEEKKDLYAVPDTDDPEELVKFIQEVMTFRPASVEEAVNHRAKASDAVQKAAKKILEVEKDKKSDTYKLASRLLFTLQANSIRAASPEEKADFYKRVKEYISESAKGPEELSLAMSVGRSFEYGDARDLAAKAYGELGDILAKSEQKQVAERAEILIGAGRRMNLMGNPLELKGTTVDGQKFNIDNLKGKVVLVDFWATWCGPCLAEYPNILKNYEAYHDKGFEVVGVSLDEDREALETYVKEKEVPWTTLHEKEAGGRHPAATYYGIMGIPSVILIDKEGKVISLNARGEELGRLLEKELGPVEKSKDEKKSS